MAVEVKNAPGQAGFVYLVFDCDIAADPLRIAICNRISRTYLGHSVGKANWSPARSHFFEAALVSRGNGETVFCVGPEVTTFIPDETTVEISTEDNAIREATVWKNILLDFHWMAPAHAADDIQRIQELENRRQADEQRRFSAEAARRTAATEVERQRQAQEAADRQRAADAAAREARRRREPGEAKARRNAELDAEARRAAEIAAKKAREGWHAADPEAPRRAAELEAELQLVTDVAAREARERREEAEAEAKRKAAKEEEQRQQEAIAAEVKARETAELAARQAEEQRQKDAAAADQKAAEETAREKGAQEEARAKAAEVEATSLAAANAQAVVNESSRAPLTDAESLPAQPPLEAGVPAAVNGPKLLSRANVGLVLILSIIAGLWVIGWGMEHPSEACSNVGLFCQRAAFREFQDCHQRQPCGACAAEYRARHPNEEYRAQVEALENTTMAACRAENEAYERVFSCASDKSCGIASCVAMYSYPNGRFTAQIDQLVETKGLRCPSDTRERTAFQRASTCSASLSCGAAHCFVDYLRDYPTGEFRAQISILAATKGLACLTVIVPRSSLTDAGFDCNRTGREIIEEMICEDDEMARANGDLQRAFDAKRLALRGNAREVLVNQERDWIVQRDRDCNVPALRPWGNLDHRRVKGCFVDKTRARRTELQH